MQLQLNSLLAACSVMVGSLGGCLAEGGLLPFDDARVTLLQMEPLMEGEDIAIISTDCGEFRIRFFPSEAPNAVNSFISLAQQGYYDNRPIFGPQGFLPREGPVLLSGSSTDKGDSGSSGVNGGKPFKKEISANLWHFTGAVSVLGDKYGKGDSRFFVTGSRQVPKEVLEEIEQARYPKSVIEAFGERGGMPEYSLDYSVFAQVFTGQEVVDAIIEKLGEEGGVSIQKVSIGEYEPPEG